MISIHQLEGFYRVAKAGSYARAAREFPYPISQPGVFAQVRRLEEQLGVRVLERAAKDRMVPTQAGRRLIAFSAPFFDGLPDIVRSAVRGEAAGRVRIDAGALEIQEILPPWVRRIRARHPDIEIELREIDAPDHGRLFRDQVDLIVEHQPALPRGISTRLIARHRAFLVVPADHPLLRRRNLRVEDFLQEPFVAFHSTLPQHALQLGALRAKGKEPDHLTLAPSVASILSFVAAGLGYSLIPWPSRSGPRMRGVAVIPVRGAGTRFPVLAAWRTRTEPDPVLDAVLAVAPRERTRGHARAT
jgi:DNA-binding transcriptional LysR family regulator